MWMHTLVNNPQVLSALAISFALIWYLAHFEFTYLSAVSKDRASSIQNAACSILPPCCKIVEINKNRENNTECYDTQNLSQNKTFMETKLQLLETSKTFIYKH